MSKMKLRFQSWFWFLGFLLIGFFLPWWSIIVVAFLVGVRNVTAKSAFIESFLTCFAAWLTLAFYFDARSGFHLSPRIGGLLKLPWPVVPAIAVAILGGLIAGLSAVSAQSLLTTLRAGNHRP